MIPIDNELHLAASTRQGVIDILSGVEDSQGLPWGMDSSPNWQTEKQLLCLLDQHEAGLLKLGAIRVTAHGDCGRVEHARNSVWRLGGLCGYWCYEMGDGRTDASLTNGDQLIVDGIVMESDFASMVKSPCPEKIPCPCTPTRNAIDHTVSRYFAWPKNSDSRMKDLAEVSLILREAISRSQDRKSRSGIRELLLRLLMHLEQMIVIQTAEQILAERSVSFDSKDS